LLEFNGNDLLQISGGMPSIVAGMVTLINAARKASGHPALGWLNPLLYVNQGTFANDITSGNNKCTSYACCDQGYYAAPGWDPVTGFGSIDFKKLYTLLVSGAVPTSSPTPSAATLASTGERWVLFVIPKIYLCNIWNLEIWYPFEYTRCKERKINRDYETSIPGQAQAVLTCQMGIMKVIF